MTKWKIRKTQFIKFLTNAISFIYKQKRIKLKNQKTAIRRDRYMIGHTFVNMRLIIAAKFN